MGGLLMAVAISVLISQLVHYVEKTMAFARAMRVLGERAKVRN